MRIKHIYITKEWEPMANPEIELSFQLLEELLNISKNQPVLHGYEIGKSSRKELEQMGLAMYYQDDDFKIEGEKQGVGGVVLTEKGKLLVSKYHSGLLPFEDITLFKAATWGKGPFVFLPSTLIPVDLEVEVVVDAETGKLFLRIKP